MDGKNMTTAEKRKRQEKLWKCELLECREASDAALLLQGYCPTPNLSIDACLFLTMVTAAIETLKFIINHGKKMHVSRIYSDHMHYSDELRNGTLATRVSSFKFYDIFQPRLYNGLVSFTESRQLS
ncbi:hypothetical protein NPIL_467391 [Nephila pilipes]|uniref:Uncharacterized protein n=1 Tax=Nephila pilipes TaxID=299642 RepID=A0A8X6U0V6_NEPPI|nr:hypothetical protein NPIL_467391 [Nephila pilipes]